MDLGHRGEHDDRDDETGDDQKEAQLLKHREEAVAENADGAGRPRDHDVDDEDVPSLRDVLRVVERPCGLRAGLSGFPSGTGGMQGKGLTNLDDDVTWDLCNRTRVHAGEGEIMRQ